MREQHTECLQGHFREDSFSRISLFSQKWQKYIARKKVGLQYVGHMSLVMGKPAFCICENKAEDQLCGNRTPDQRLCFRYTDSTIPLFPKYEISSLLPSSVAVQPCSCGTWLETPKTRFLTTRLIWTPDNAD